MRKYWIAGITTAMAVSMAFPALAGEWVQDPSRPANVNGISNWWFRNDDGTYPKDTWAWLDGNKDGVYESYRFDGNGWMYASAKVDGYDVDASGAWVDGGRVQQKYDKTAKNVEVGPDNLLGADTSEKNQAQADGKNQWVKDSRGKRYLDSNGAYAKGWQTYSGKKYYFDAEGYALTGLQTIEDKEYYFLSTGELATKTVHDSKKKFYYVVNKSTYVIVDTVPEDSWGEYCKDGDTSIANFTTLLDTSGKEEKNVSSNSNLTYGINEDWEQTCFSLINNERTKRKLTALTYDEALQEACEIRAEELVEKNSHTRPDGSKYQTVFDEVGLEPAKYAENIGSGYTTASAMVKGWMDSNAHKANILSQKYKRSAVGFYYDENQSQKYYWVQIFTD